VRVDVRGRADASLAKVAKSVRYLERVGAGLQLQRGQRVLKVVEALARKARSRKDFLEILSDVARGERASSPVGECETARIPAPSCRPRHAACSPAISYQLTA
jgi:hypothetical protein